MEEQPQYQSPNVDTIGTPAGQPQTIQPPVQEPQRKSMKKLYIIIGSFVVLATLGVIIYFLWNSNGSSAVVLDAVVSDSVPSGTAFPFNVTISNGEGSPLNNAQLVIQLPDSMVFTGPDQKTFQSIDLGTIAAGQLAKQSLQIIAIDSENTVKNIQMSLTYSEGVLSSRFEKSTTKSVAVGDAAASLDITPPSSVFGGAQFDTIVTYKNVSANVLQNVQLHALYPDGFQFSSASPAPTTGSNVWQLGDLSPGETSQIKLTGSLSGQSGGEFNLQLELSSDSGDGRYTVATKAATVTLAASPLNINISLNNTQNLIVSAGDRLSYKLTYANNTSVGLRDVVVTAKLSGDMFDLKSLQTDGFLRSSDTTVVWNTSRVPSLALLPTGGSGSLEFTIMAKDQFPITRLSSKNFTLKVTAAITSPTVPREIAANQAMASASLENKMRGKLAVKTSVLYRDAASGIANSGTLPPRVGQGTQYTVHWKLANYATDVDTVVVKAFLGPNVTVTGASSTNVGSLSFNPNTQEVTWNVSSTIAATRGILSPAYEGIFQIQLQPSVDQLNQVPVLINQTNVSYHDTFTDETLNSIDGAVTTQLPDDPSVQNDQKAVAN